MWNRKDEDLKRKRVKKEREKHADGGQRQNRRRLGALKARYVLSTSKENSGSRNCLAVCEFPH